jgi:hypothetical protein
MPTTLATLLGVLRGVFVTNTEMRMLLAFTEFGHGVSVF